MKLSADDNQGKLMSSILKFLNSFTGLKIKSLIFLRIGGKKLTSIKRFSLFEDGRNG